MLLVSAVSVCFDFDMSAPGQKAKCSLQVDVFRFTLNSRHRQAAPTSAAGRTAPLIAGSIGGAVLLFDCVATKLD